jgi:hypothetical protein
MEPRGFRLSSLNTFQGSILFKLSYPGLFNRLISFIIYILSKKESFFFFPIKFLYFNFQLPDKGFGKKG